MSDVRELLERESTTVDLEHGHFERMLHRRDRKRRNQRIVAGVVAIVIVLVCFAALSRAVRGAVPADKPPSPPSFDGMVITYTSDPYQSGDLVAQDPATGEVSRVLDSLSGESPIYNAAISGDNRLVAFDIATQCGDAGPRLWVTNGVDKPRPLTDPCDVSSGADVLGLWEWSPSGAQLVVVLGTAGDALVLIDPATGERTTLEKTTGRITSLAWSPDGSRIAYGTVPVGTGDGGANSVRASVHSVDVSSGNDALLANVIGQVPGGEEGSGIRWSPDGRRIAVLGGINDARLYLMRADGSGVSLLTEGAPNVDWSPDGTRIAYATIPGNRDRLQIWNGSPDGSTPVLVFDPTSPPEVRTLSGDPVWSPDGTQIAFRYDPNGEEKGWLVANADGTGDAHEIDELQYLSWHGGGYFCECYG
jgi:Tol biopolymer transport system component